MKISKLFHWLYAILMLLPVFAVGVTCAYVIFNKNAYKSYNASNEYILSNATSVQDLNNEENSTTRIIFNKQILGVEQFDNLIVTWTNPTFIAGNLSQTNIEKINNSTGGEFYRNNNKPFLRIDYTLSRSAYYIDLSTEEFTFDIQNFALGNISLFNQIQPYIYYYELNIDNSISNVFYQSIDTVQQSPLFNWSYDSFLATPITYISDLFGIASCHPVILLMSYWLSISIIWLVFDMVMYVPLLVHRWIDKGVLE